MLPVSRKLGNGRPNGVGKVFLSFRCNNSCGVGILFLSEVSYSFFTYDHEGCLVVVDAVLDKKSIRFICTYCPNSLPDRKLFLESHLCFFSSSARVIQGGGR